MNANQLQLVTFEQAQKLKEAGFYWETDKCYYYNNESNISTENFGTCDYNNSKDFRCTSALTVALALKWFRDVKKITASIVRYNDDGVIKWIGGYNEQKLKYTKMFDTYEAAESALLNELLTLLEK